jgi:hypothetical protein
MVVMAILPSSAAGNAFRPLYRTADVSEYRLEENCNGWSVVLQAEYEQLRPGAPRIVAGSIAVASQDLVLHHYLMPDAPRTSTQTEILAGLVDRVTFHNSENGFCVLRVKARGQRDLITVIGHAAMISADEFVQASGSWINRTHGVQFRASFLKATAPTTVEGIEKYLGSGMIRGIGPAYANKLVSGVGTWPTMCSA